MTPWLQLRWKLFKITSLKGSEKIEKSFGHQTSMTLGSMLIFTESLRYSTEKFFVGSLVECDPNGL